MMTDPVNVREYEALAREAIEPGAWGYIAGGAGDEISLRENDHAYDRLRLWPRVLVDVTEVDTSTELLGRRVSAPILLAPTAFQTLSHPDGERATARGAATVDTVMVVSTMSSYPLEEVAEAADGGKWFQLYAYRDREVTEGLIRRAEAAGYEALCLSIDLPRPGRRERDHRSGFQLPDHARPANFAGVVDDERSRQAVDAYVAGLIDASLTWEIVPWMRDVTSLPIALKGILRADDARRAVDAGVDAIVVSNHGARQLDTVPATIDALPAIAEAVGTSATLLVDGGIRRGTDVVKALALGADAVLIGRPYVWGLAVDGAAGVERVFELLRDELELAMALCGCIDVASIDRDVVD